MNRRKRRRSGPVWGLALLTAAILAAGLLLVSRWERRTALYAGPTEAPAADFFSRLGWRQREELETILILGLDKFSQDQTPESYNNDRQADFLLLLILDHEARTAQALHLDRDTMTDVNVLGVAGQTIDIRPMQLALAHTYGNGKKVSCRNTADAVSGLLRGVQIDHYLSMTMDAVAVLNDLAGGVTLEVLEDFTGIDSSLVKGQTVTLWGEQALRYVRIRKGLEDSTNNTRMVRQRQYLEALSARLRQSLDQDEGFVEEALSQLSGQLISDLSASQLQTLARQYGAYTPGPVHTLTGQTQKGERFMEFRPDEEALQTLVLTLFGEKLP